MKSSSGWNNNGNGSNSSGFNGLPGGFRYSTSFGGFNGNGNNGLWWSASESGSDSWDRTLYYDHDDVHRGDYYRYNGYSARCVRD